MKRLIWVLCILSLLWSDAALAGGLSDRVAAFPNWRSQPPVDQPVGDLIYPAWIAGEWRVKSMLIDLVAPLAPKIVTPGFESNRAFVNQAIEFNVRFAKQTSNHEIVADRAFNGLNIARAYLGDRAVSVKVDPNSPNKQITTLRNDLSLTSTITGRAIESSTPDALVTTELFQQVFRGTAQPYFNQVETTTAYKYLANRSPRITAEQLTAIYLSPQDPNYFDAGNTPVALYRYRLEFFPLTESIQTAE